MKKPTCLVLTIIGVLLLIVGLVVVVPWITDIVKEFSKVQEHHQQYMITIRQYVNAPLTEEQEQLLSQLLMEQNDISNTQNPNELESILSTEPYLTYLNTQDGQDYSEYTTFVDAMPTLHYESIVNSRLAHFFDTEIDEVTQRIWTDFYFIIREWGKDGKTQSNSQKEFSDLLQRYLVEPIVEHQTDTGGFSKQVIKMGIISAVIVEDNEVFHRVWNRRIQSHGLREGYLRSAIATPEDFALMRSFFENAEEFVEWLTEPFGLEEEEIEVQENQ